MEIINSIEKESSETTAEFLLRLKNDGYIFHGSSNSELSILEPKPAFDKNSAENTDTAIFATDDIVWTTIFGVWGGHRGWKTVTHDNGSVLAKIPRSDKESVEMSSGTVYVLSKEHFGEPNMGRQFKSHVAVTPYTKVQVTLKDYFDLGGEVEWVEPS